MLKTDLKLVGVEARFRAAVLAEAVEIIQQYGGPLRVGCALNDRSLVETLEVFMKTIWSAFISFLLLLLVMMFAAFGFVTAKPLPIRLFAFALGLYFLITFISATWPERQTADRLLKVLNFCAGASCVVAMLLVLQRYFNTVPMR